MSAIEELSTQPQKSTMEKVAEQFTKDVGPERYDDYLSNNGRQNRQFAFFVGGQAYGSLGAGHEFTQMEMRNEMKRKGIDYFLHFTSNEQLEFSPDDYSGELVATYYLGDKYRGCEDQRSGNEPVKCWLYIIEPIY